MRSENISYLPGIDQLRGIAALWIVFYHVAHIVSYRLTFERPFALDHWPVTANPLTASIFEGHVAVGLFMVLSGFILSYGAWGKELQYVGFLRNRLLRIYPLMIFLIMVPAYSMPEQFSWSALWQSILLGHNLPGAYAAAPYTDMFWAISVEFAFYLMFPFLCVILKKNGVSTFVAMIVVLIVFRGLATIFGGNPRDFSYFTLLGRLDQFLIGMLLGALSGAKPEQRPNLWLFPLTALFWSVILWQFNQMGGWPLVVWWKILWPTIEALLAALFIYSYLRFSFYIPSPIATTLRGIGVISYSLYLVHMIVITLVLDQAPQFTWMPHSATWLIAGLIIPGTFLLATLTYFAIERPFLGLRRRYFLVASP